MTPNAAPAIQDLGQLDGALLIFGGVDGNLDALEALLKFAAERGIPFTRMIYTGSVAPFCAEPVACAQQFAELGIAAVKGSFEVDAPQLAQGAGVVDLSEMVAPGWKRILEDGLPPELADWMEALPAELVFSLGGYTFRVVHGGVTSMEKLLFRSSAGPAFQPELSVSTTDVVIAGRSGLPFTRLFSASDGPGQAWHNPGSLGLPPNDGTPRVWASMVRSASSGLVFDHMPIAYDHRTAANRLRRQCGDEVFSRWIESGLWPSLDDLPQGERRRRGKPIEPHRVTFGLGDERTQERPEARSCDGNLA
ncbi:metallophosphoesterase family protein [Rhodoligotrophos ferricapiens]|uniref:metallophosphoesterase family protein n=1 Tax=Rhodoligotrophos ferricapiens TaxID=3069264 RepID=UPI00315DB7EB